MVPRTASQSGGALSPPFCSSRHRGQGCRAQANPRYASDSFRRLPLFYVLTPDARRSVDVPEPRKASAARPLGPRCSPPHDRFECGTFLCQQGVLVVVNVIVGLFMGTPLLHRLGLAMPSALWSPWLLPGQAFAPRTPRLCKAAQDSVETDAAPVPGLPALLVLEMLQSHPCA